MKLPDFGLSKWIFYVKNQLNLSNFFSMKNKNLGAHILVTSILEPLYYLKSCPIFDKTAKGYKASEGAYK